MDPGKESSKDPPKDPSKDPLIGSKLADRYRIVSVLGRGGMGVVYQAEDEQTDRVMAVKMLHAHKVADSEALKRFNREARTVAQLNHHHIVTLYDFGMSKQGQPYLVMDFIEGRSLKDELLVKGALPFDRAMTIFEQVLDALEFAHSQDIVHRDLKPENIILAKHRETEDWVKLVDFGLSKLKETDPFGEDVYQITRAGDVCGSPPYMSPEQCLSNSVVDTRSDIYSMAIVVYETLSGCLPFKAKSAIEMMDCHLYGTPIPFSQAIPELKACNETTYVLNRALSKEPEARHLTASEFLKELKNAMRRDWPKVRSYRYRMEDVNFRDLESEAEALATGEHPALDLAKMSSGVQEVINELRTETSVHQGQSTRSQHPGKGQSQPMEAMGFDEEEEDYEEPSGFLDKLLSFFRRDGRSSHEEYHHDLGYSNCPFCSAPVRAQLRFCVNCQRQLPTVQEFSRLRMQQGRFALAKTATGNNKDSKGFSQRAKARSSSPGMSFIQKVLTLMLVALLCYGGYNSLQDKAIQKKIQNVIKALK
ncbi:MAG: serine/threonine protein kinase [Candidatus Obscuribacterales bacterium]